MTQIIQDILMKNKISNSTFINLPIWAENKSEKQLNNMATDYT